MQSLFGNISRDQAFLSPLREFPFWVLPGNGLRTDFSCCSGISALLRCKTTIHGNQFIKRKKKSKLQVLFNAKMSFVWYFTHHFIFLRVYAWARSWSLHLSSRDCDVQTGALALGFSRKKWLQLPSSEVRLSQEAPSCSAEEAAPPGQAHCTRCWLTGRGSWRPGYETEGLEFFPAPVCLWLCYGN